MRPSGRAPDQLREIKLTRDYTCHAEGSVLVEFGKTKVICTVSIEDRVPGFLKGKGQGWLTAEYGMLPRSTNSRMRREATQSSQGGRTMEIQRLIGRSLRAVVDLKKLGERTLTIDCDVIQADGGTRTASITGAYVALVDAVRSLQYEKVLNEDPVNSAIASVSVGIYQGTAVLDLDTLLKYRALQKVMPLARMNLTRCWHWHKRESLNSSRCRTRHLHNVLA